jgi:hypothetical protein
MILLSFITQLSFTLFIKNQYINLKIKKYHIGLFYDIKIYLLIR